MAPGIPKTRLDPLVRWKERELERARVAWQAKVSALLEWQRQIEAAKAALAIRPEAAADAALWALHDQAASAGRAALVGLEAAVRSAEAELQVARQACLTAKQECEAFRKASERQRAKLLEAVELRERKTMDELALLLRRPP